MRRDANNADCNGYARIRVCYLRDMDSCAGKQFRILTRRRASLG
jgi:hypothetical protein